MTTPNFVTRKTAAKILHLKDGGHLTKVLSGLTEHMVDDMVCYSRDEVQELEAHRAVVKTTAEHNRRAALATHASEIRKLRVSANAVDIMAKLDVMHADIQSLLTEWRGK